MKLFKYGLPFAALAVLASCSNDNTIDAPGVADVPEDGYNASFVIAMPTTGGSRAFDEDYDEGTTQENTVRNACVYIYKANTGDTEDDYEFVTKSQVFYTTTNNPSEDNDIAKTVTINVRLNDVETENIDYYGLCIVNLDDSNNGAPGNGFITPDDSSLADKKFGTWRKAVMGSTETIQNPFRAVINNEYADEAKTIGYYFTMTNAPQFEGDDFDDWANPPFTLVKVATENFVEAPGRPTKSAATFYVQRGVAKVVLAGKDGQKLSEIKSTMNDGKDVFAAHGWSLDVTNRLTYPVQNIDKVYNEIIEAQSAGALLDAAYFATPANGTKTSIGRIWWANDPNYDGTYNYKDFYMLHYDAQGVNNTPSWLVIGTDNNEQLVDYCHENTMVYNQMIQDRTTRIVVKGQYIVEAAKNSTEKSFVVNPNTDEAYPVTFAKLKQNVESRLGSAENGYSLRDLYASETDSEIETVANAIHMNPQGLDKVDFYLNGETYYVARIHHFDPTLETPLGVDYWSDEPIKIETADNYTAQHTGRYGMLRNNVYKINIEKVLGYGSPTIPTPDETPDDDPETKKYNVQVDINVLKWANREYDYTLK